MQKLSWISLLLLIAFISSFPVNVKNLLTTSVAVLPKMLHLAEEATGFVAPDLASMAYRAYSNERSIHSTGHVGKQKSRHLYKKPEAYGSIVVNHALAEAAKEAKLYTSVDQVLGKYIQLVHANFVADPSKGPNNMITPGHICNQNDKDYIETDEYGIHRCKRQVSKSTRNVIRQLYGVDKSRKELFELDHLYPLCLGGSNHPGNLWMQFRDEKHKKAITHG